MEKSGADAHAAHQTHAPVDDAPASGQKPKRIGIFSIFWRILLAVVLLAAAIYLSFTWVSDPPEGAKRQRRERSFTVVVQEAQSGTYQPEIRVFGEIVAGRTIELRSQVAGELLQVSPNLVAGGRVAEGELLSSVDQFDYQSAVRQSTADVDDANLQLVSAQEQLKLNKINLETAQSQLTLAERDFERARALGEAGTVTNKAVEDRQFTVSQRQQTVAQQTSAIAIQETAIARQKSAISRTELALEKAIRALANTEIYAPFDGIVISTNVGEGRIISNNEIVAQIYETGALEVQFTISDVEYGQLVAAGLAGRQVKATWDVAPNPIIVSGEIVRVGAQVDAALGGVTMFARLEGEQLINLRPGTFVGVSITGITYNDTHRLPETALYDNGAIYVLEDGRMQPVQVEIRARDGAYVIVSGPIADDARIITTHMAQAGQGVRVDVEGEEPAVPAGRPQFGGGPDGAGGQRPGGAPQGRNGPAGQDGQSQTQPQAGQNASGEFQRPNRANGERPSNAQRPEGAPQRGQRREGADGQPGERPNARANGENGAGPRAGQNAGTDQQSGAN